MSATACVIAFPQRQRESDAAAALHVLGREAGACMVIANKAAHGRPPNADDIDRLRLATARIMAVLGVLE